MFARSLMLYWFICLLLLLIVVLSMFLLVACFWCFISYCSAFGFICLLDLFGLIALRLLVCFGWVVDLFCALSFCCIFYFYLYLCGLLLLLWFYDFFSLLEHCLFCLWVDLSLLLLIGFFTWVVILVVWVVCLIFLCFLLIAYWLFILTCGFDCLLVAIVGVYCSFGWGWLAFAICLWFWSWLGLVILNLLVFW